MSSFFTSWSDALQHNCFALEVRSNKVFDFTSSFIIYRWYGRWYWKRRERHGEIKRIWPGKRLLEEKVVSFDEVKSLKNQPKLQRNWMKTKKKKLKNCVAFTWCKKHSYLKYASQVIKVPAKFLQIASTVEVLLTFVVARIIQTYLGRDENDDFFSGTFHGFRTMFLFTVGR